MYLKNFCSLIKSAEEEAAVTVFSVTLVISIVVAVASRLLFHASVAVFISSAAALVILSKFLGDATEALSHHVGEQLAGLLNVTLSNLAEIIIIFVAIRAGLIELVQASIVGSIIGNLLLVLGLSIYLGCKKHGTMEFSHDTAILFINQLFLVSGTLMLPTIFGERIPAERQQTLSYWLAGMLVIAYVYFYRLSLVDKRFRVITKQVDQLNLHWSRRSALTVLATCAAGAFFMSELLVNEVDAVGLHFGISKFFMGFVLVPFLGNIAERSVAIMAAKKRLTELSLSVSIGSAAQVAMIIAPAAVLFGALCGNPVTLHFADLPLAALVMSSVLAFVVLHDGKWNINEGAMLIAFYGALVLCFFFAR